MTSSTAIEHPPHYIGNGIECIDAIKSMLGEESFVKFCGATAAIYIWRHEHKGQRLEDLKKAQVYLDWAVETMEEIESA